MIGDKTDEHPARKRLHANRSGVLVTDIQRSFLSVLPEDQSWISQVSSFLQVPKMLDVPILITEQTPDKLGTTVDSIRQAVPESPVVHKSSYNCMDCEKVTGWIDRKEVSQLVILGVMTNICILHTALEVSSRGVDTHVPSDGTRASSQEDHWWGLRRMERAGVVVTTLETTAHEWLGSPEHEKFSELLPVLKELTR